MIQLNLRWNHDKIVLLSYWLKRTFFISKLFEVINCEVNYKLRWNRDQIVLLSSLKNLRGFFMEEKMLNYIQQILPALLGGTKVTLSIFAITLIIAIPLGILLGVTLTSKFKPIKWLLNTYILIMRGTPLLLQLIFIFYGLPLLGIVFSRYNAALIAFILNYAAYFSEIFRGGFQSIPKGQIESAKLLRLSKWQTLRYVLAPQVFKIVLPSVGNETINLIKDSSLVYVIGIGDLLRAGNVATARDVTLLPLILVGIIYLILTAITTYILKAIEKRTNVWR